MAGRDVASRWLTWLPSWISEQNDFSNSKSPCGPKASKQVWAQSDLGTVLEEMLFEEFQDGRYLGYRNGTMLAILNLYVAPMPPIKFWLNPTYSLGGDVF